MSQKRQSWSARESIIRKKKLVELENAMFKQDNNSGLSPLRLIKAELRRRKKTVADLERGWSNGYKGTTSKQPSFQPLPCFGVKDKAKERRGDLFRNECEKSKKKGEKVDEGWVTNFRDQKTKELDVVYGKDSSTMKFIDRRLEAAWVGNCKEHRRIKGRSRVLAEELQKARFEKRLESPSVPATQRSYSSTWRAARSPRERSDRFLDTVCVRSPKGIGAEFLSVDRSCGDISDVCVSRQEDQKDTDADTGWTSRRSPRRAASRHNVPRTKTAEEMIKEREDKFRENSWFNACQHGQRGELFGLRSYSIGHHLSRKVNGENLSWAANSRAKGSNDSRSVGLQDDLQETKGDIKRRSGR